jgi:TatD DNase family protein
MRLTDTHCHLPSCGGDDAVIEAKAAGVERMISVGTDADESRKAIEIAERHDGVWATVGLHPHEARFGVDSIWPLLDPDPARRSSKVIAVGECGLDYFYDHSPREAQRIAFAEQIELAHRLDLPLVIHTRDAWDDTFAVLAEAGVPRRTIFHCFTGGPVEARRCLDIDAFLSFSGIVSFRTAGENRDAAALAPADRLLVETDAPYLAPVPHRGRPNRPALVSAVLTAVAHARSVAESELSWSCWVASDLAFGFDASLA